MSQSHKALKEIIKEIQNQNYITIDQYESLKYYSIQPGGFSRGNKKTNENQKIIYKALLNMLNTNEEINFINKVKCHPSLKVQEKFKDGLENTNNPEEIIVLNKDIPRNIFFQWKKNEKEFDYELNNFEKQIEKFLKENKNKYSYYQGFLDFCVYFYVIFHEKNNKENNDYIKVLQFFTELYLKDYISPFKSIGIKEDVIFQNSLNLLIGIIKIIDNDLYKIFKEESSPLSLILSWTISLFSHSVNNFYTLRRILDYILISEPITSYVLTSMILVKCLKKNIKNFLEAEIEEFFLTIKNINLDEIDFDNYIIQCEQFIKDNLEDILIVQEKNKEAFILLGDYNFRGTENVIYSYNNEIIEKRYLRKKSFIISYQFIFVLFLVWIFVIYFFHKDEILEGLNENKDIKDIYLNNNTNNKYIKNNFTDEDDEF